MSPFARPTFDANGRVVARRALTMGERTYDPGQELSAEDRAALAGRIGTLWQLGMIDTPPAEPTDADLERLTAPAPRAQPAKTSNARR